MKRLSLVVPLILALAEWSYTAMSQHIRQLLRPCPRAHGSANKEIVRDSASECLRCLNISDVQRTSFKLPRSGLGSTIIGNTFQVKWNFLQNPLQKSEIWWKRTHGRGGHGFQELGPVAAAALGGKQQSSPVKVWTSQDRTFQTKGREAPARGSPCGCQRTNAVSVQPLQPVFPCHALLRLKKSANHKA